MKRAAVLIALAACGGKAAPTPAPTPAPEPTAAATYRFDWPPPCRVPVVETLDKNGSEIVIHYTIDLRASGYAELAVEHLGISVVSIDGTDVRNAPHSLERRMLTEAAEARPTIVIDRDGAFLRADGLLKVVDFALANIPVEQHSTFGPLMRSPEWMELLADQFADEWNAAVGFWAGLTLHPGERVAAHGGTIEHLGTSDELTRLRLERLFEGDAFLAKMGPAVLALYAGFQGSSPLSDLDYQTFVSRVDGTRAVSYEVTTDPASLRPKKAVTETRSELRFDGQPVKASNSRHTKEFAWDRAIGCGR